ncbi:MAG: LCP family protein [Actinomycetota bacterium]
MPADDWDRTQMLPQSGGRAPDAPPGSGVRAPGAPGGREPGAPRGRPTDDPARSAGDLASGRRRRGVRWVALVVVLLVAYPLALLAVAWTSLNRTAALGDSAATPGRTYLVVGSDSRAGLTAAQRKALRTGTAAGQRTDTILLLHVPSGRGPTVLMSVPRDSYVDIPGHGKGKINAAFSLGGAALLARTVEQNTGIGVDDYVEVGFAGFADMVDAVGGVRICPKRAINDRRAGLDIAKGCQQAQGATALGYARARYSDPRGDLGRVERQRELLAAIVTKATSPATLVNPLRTFPLASSGAGALTVDSSTGPIALARFVLGMKASSGSSGVSLTVPVRGTATRAGSGSVVLWDTTKATAVFAAIARDDTTAVRAYAAQQKP